jgi:hypothetical protein
MFIDRLYTNIFQKIDFLVTLILFLPSNLPETYLNKTKSPEIWL